jgi:hypothetical protein
MFTKLFFYTLLVFTCNSILLYQHVLPKRARSEFSNHTLVLKYSPSVWMEPRRGGVTCEVCTEAVSCQQNYLTFGAFDGSADDPGFTRIAITSPNSLESTYESAAKV